MSPWLAPVAACQHVLMIGCRKVAPASRLPIGGKKRRAVSLAGPRFRPIRIHFVSPPGGALLVRATQLQHWLQLEFRRSCSDGRLRSGCGGVGLGNTGGGSGGERGWLPGQTMPYSCYATRTSPPKHARCVLFAQILAHEHQNARIHTGAHIQTSASKHTQHMRASTYARLHKDAQAGALPHNIRSCVMYAHTHMHRQTHTNKHIRTNTPH